MNTKDIPDQLAALTSALVAKIGAQPWLPLKMEINDGGKFKIRIYGKTYEDGSFGAALADTAEKCLNKAAEIIADIPDPETKARRDWHGKLAEVIDEGHALALPDDVMQPLRAGSQAMTENLIAHDKGDAT